MIERIVFASQLGIRRVAASSGPKKTRVFSGVALSRPADSGRSLVPLLGFVSWALVATAVGIHVSASIKPVMEPYIEVPKELIPNDERRLLLLHSTFTNGMGEVGTFRDPTNFKLPLIDSRVTESMILAQANSGRYSVTPSLLTSLIRDKRDAIGDKTPFHIVKTPTGKFAIKNELGLDQGERS